MAKKKKTGTKKPDSPEGLWIAPRYSLKGPQGERAWENRPGGVPKKGRRIAKEVQGNRQRESGFRPGKR